MNFQEELKKNIRTPEDAKRENEERLNEAMIAEARRTLQEIKRALLQNAKDAKYTTQNGTITISCFRGLPLLFVKTRSESNMMELFENNKKCFLFRDHSLVPKKWKVYDIASTHKNDYQMYVKVLKQLAAEENISIECGVYDALEDKMLSFPLKVTDENIVKNGRYVSRYDVCIRASTVMSDV